MRSTICKAAPAALPKILIAYGSHTGTSETYAKMLGTFATGHGYTPIVATLNDSAAILAEESKSIKAMLVVASTCGTGEFPSNSEKFYKYLVAGELNEHLKDMPYTVMGLGNSNNESFNTAAKNIDKQMRDLGAKNILRLQLSCELQPNGHDSTFRLWKRNIWAKLGNGGGEAGPAKIPSTYNVAQVIDVDPPVLPHHFVQSKVTANPIISADKYEPHSMHVTFKVPEAVQEATFGRRATFQDQVLIHPVAAVATAERAAKCLGLRLKDMVELTPLPGATKSYFDGHKMTVENVLREIVDLNAMPSRTMLETLVAPCADETQKNALDELANDLSAKSKYDGLVEAGFTIVDLLEKFPALQMNLAQLLSVAPHIAPRTYSMSRDNTNWHHDEFEIVYNVPTKENHVGLCTSMMQGLKTGDHMAVSFLQDQVTVPKLENPVVIMALGSGIGSARALLQSRQLAKSKGEKVGPAVLMYGFRHTDKDQLFKADLNAMAKEGIVDVRYVASRDVEGKLVTPMDVMDRSIVDFLSTKGEIVYCGLGGSVPLKVEAAFQKNGVDVATLRSTGRYHEEYFTVDHDMENLLRSHSGGIDGADTLVGKMGNCEMFCFQCEQTFKNQGCHKIGVCGKTPKVAALQDLCTHGAKLLGFYCAGMRSMGMTIEDEMNHITLYSLFTTLTNVNFDEGRFEELVSKMQKIIARAKSAYEAECTKQGKAIGAPTIMELPAVLPKDEGLHELGRMVSVLKRFSDPATQSAAGVSEMLMYGLKGIAAYADHSLMNKMEDQSIYEFMHRALAFLAGPDSLDLGKALELTIESGKVNVTTMSLLYDSNKTLGVPCPCVVDVKPTPGKCILVSGHDLVILKGLLEVTEPLGINVYTHGEMLPAFSYPDLKKHKNLAGHFGGAWMRQSIEFPHFPGPVLMTTNCITEPHEEYAARIFTAGAVGWKGVPHIGENMVDIKFDSLIAAAQAADGFSKDAEAFTYADPVGQKRPKTLTVGFGHETVLSVAPTIVEEIGKGNITRFFVVGGCDGFEGQRSYYTELVSKMPKTAVVLTVGCGKFRLNHLELGTIGDTGIPRVLDMGQCNDSFSAVQVALALAGVLKCEVGDLPLSIVLSWFEQKAVAVLLSCISLGLKPIYVGPSLPAFLTPEVLNVLVTQFGIKPCGDPEADLKDMLAAKGMGWPAKVEEPAKAEEEPKKE